MMPGMSPSKRSASKHKRFSERELQVLAILDRELRREGGEGELNGRQIAKAFEDAHGAPIPYATLYTLLAAMQGAGWVEGRQTVHEGRRTRWSRITSVGQEQLREGRAYFRKLADFALGDE